MRILVIVAVIGFFIGKSSAEGTGVIQMVAVVDSSGQAQEAIPSLQNDTAGKAAAPLTPLCTLDITTEPPGAMVVIDGQQSGTSPLVIAGVAAGKHTIVLQKAGYYQKKAVVDIPAAGRTPVGFELSAPGSLSIVSEPAGAAVTINGEERGTTPYLDSLVKPGIYHVAIRKEHYNRIEDTMSVSSGGKSVYKGMLTFVSAYGDSLQRSAQTDRIRKKRINIGVIGGAFALFLLTLAFIELKE